MLQSIRTKVDGIEFFHVKIAHSSILAHLRTTLVTKYSLSSSTYFLDTQNYRVAREDEQTNTIKQILHENDTVHIITDENAANLTRPREQIVKKSSTFIITELFSILEWLWRLLLKPLIIMTLMFLFLYYGYTKLVCYHGHFLPFVTMYCPVEQSKTSPVPPLGNQAENTASLAAALANADVSAPVHCTQAKIALIEIRAQILYSDIDNDVREQLGEQILELKKLTELGADQLTSMLASFGGVIDRLKLYTQHLLEDLSKVQSTDIRRSRQLQIDYLEAETTDSLTESFEEYTKVINRQVDKVLIKAEEAHLSLERITNKLETIQELNYKGKQISQARLDQLQHGSIWSRLNDEGSLGIVKHQRNIQTLNGFIGFTKSTSENIHGIITKLKSFKSDASNLKEATAELDLSRRKSLEREVQIIEAALKRLSQSKQAFEKKIEQKNPST